MMRIISSKWYLRVINLFVFLKIDMLIEKKNLYDDLFKMNIITIIKNDENNNNKISLLLTWWSLMIYNMISWGMWIIILYKYY